MNTYAMGLRPFYFFNYFSAGIDFRRRILTYKVGLRAERVEHCWRLAETLDENVILCFNSKNDANQHYEHTAAECDQDY